MLIVRAQVASLRAEAAAAIAAVTAVSTSAGRCFACTARLLCGSASLCSVRADSGCSPATSQRALVASKGVRLTAYVYHRVPKFSPYGKRACACAQGLACRKRVAAASSPAATCKQDAALTSPARHACGCARPSRARLGHRNSIILSDGSKT